MSPAVQGTVWEAVGWCDGYEGNAFDPPSQVRAWRRSYRRGFETGQALRRVKAS